MKMWNIPDDNIIFLLRNINCHNRIQSILKSHEKNLFKNPGLISWGISK